MRKQLTILSILLCSFTGIIAQELQFSQYFSSSLYLNPAFSAIYVDPTIFVNYRRPLDAGELTTENSQISATLPLFINESDNTPRGGVGVMAYNSSSGFLGSFKITGVMVNYGHNFSIGALNTEVIAIGIQGGYENYRIDDSGFESPSQYNPYIDDGFDRSRPGVSVSDAVSHPIINAGIMYYYNRERNFNIYNYSAFSGFAVTNLNTPNKSFANVSGQKTPMLFKYHGGIEFKANKANIMPNILIEYQQRNYIANGGMYFVYRASNAYNNKKFNLISGAWYRLRDSFVFLGGIQFNSINIKVSYDMNSKLFFDNSIDINRNHMEISLQYNFTNETVVRKISNPLF